MTKKPAKDDRIVLGDLTDKVPAVLGPGPEAKRCGTIVITPGVLIPTKQVERLLELLKGTTLA